MIGHAPSSQLTFHVAPSGWGGGAAARRREDPKPETRRKSESRNPKAPRATSVCNFCVDHYPPVRSSVFPSIGGGGATRRLTQVSHDPHQTLVNRASDFLGTTKSPRFPGPALALLGNPQSVSHSGSVALRHSDINKALTLTAVYSPYNEHFENTTVDYQGLTKDKWRKSLLIDS